MADSLRRQWTWDTYLAWEATQPLRYELVDGRVYAMGGGTLGHDAIANNLRGALQARLRGRPCRVNGPDVKVATGTGNARYPDALLDFGRFVANAVLAQEPVAVFEVLSKSTAWIDQGLKLRDYDATPSIRQYVLVSQDEPKVLVYTRGDNGRLDLKGAALLEGIEAVLSLQVGETSLPLSELYEGLEFAAA